MSAEDGSRIADLVLTTNDGNPECYVLRHRSGEYEEYPSLGKAIVAMAILGEYEQIDPPYEYSSLSWAINNGHWRTEVHGAWVKVEKKKDFGPAAFFAAMAARTLFLVFGLLLRLRRCTRGSLTTWQGSSESRLRGARRHHGVPWRH